MSLFFESFNHWPIAVTRTPSMEIKENFIATLVELDEMGEELVNLSETTETVEKIYQRMKNDILPLHAEAAAHIQKNASFTNRKIPTQEEYLKGIECGGLSTQGIIEKYKTQTIRVECEDYQRKEESWQLEQLIPVCDHLGTKINRVIQRLVSLNGSTPPLAPTKPIDKTNLHLRCEPPLPRIWRAPPVLSPSTPANPSFLPPPQPAAEPKPPVTSEPAAAPAPVNPVVKTLTDVVTRFQENKNQEAFTLFRDLSKETQGSVFGKLWEVMGKPTNESKEEPLRLIAHPDFGKVSFFDEESRCYSPLSKKIEALQAVISTIQ